MLFIDHARWGQTPEDLRRLATSAPHRRTRERFLALYEITQECCATPVRCGRLHPDPCLCPKIGPARIRGLALV